MDGLAKTEGAVNGRLALAYVFGDADFYHENKGAVTNEIKEIHGISVG